MSTENSKNSKGYPYFFNWPAKKNNLWPLSYLWLPCSTITRLYFADEKQKFRGRKKNSYDYFNEEIRTRVVKTISGCSTHYAIAHLVIVGIEERCEVETPAPLFDTRRETGHVTLQLARHSVDFRRVALPGACQLLRSRQQLLCVCVRVLKQKTPEKLTKLSLKKQKKIFKESAWHEKL